MRRANTLISMDGRRLFRSKLFFIMLGISLAVPILILVMTTMVGGAETASAGFENVWQIIGSVGGGMSVDMNANMNMDMTAMCNINLLYFAAMILVCIFVSKEFSSGYAKNIFSIRADKKGYVYSKTVICSLGGMIMLLCFLLGSILGGAIAGLSFQMVGFTAANLVLCLLAKLLLMPVFVAISLCMSVIAKEKTWLSILLSCMAGMLLFMMIPLITPLNAGVMQVVLCMAGSILFGFGLGAVSGRILKKTALV